MSLENRGRLFLAVIVFGCFLLGTSQFPARDGLSAEVLGVVFGLASALCWGFTAIEDKAPVSMPMFAGRAGYFNAFAAAFAALAVGYLMPASVCDPKPRGPLLQAVCRIHP